MSGDLIFAGSGCEKLHAVCKPQVVIVCCRHCAVHGTAQRPSSGMLTAEQQHKERLI